MSAPEHGALRTPTDEREGNAFGIAAITGAVFLVLYVRRLCPTLCLSGDSAELVTAAAVWGVPHAPGYPLFTTIGHLFASVPIHSVAWRVNVTSALFHAGTVALTVATSFAIVRSRVAAVTAGCALGLSRTFFLGSLYAEVFPLNDLFFAALLFLAMRLRARPHAPAAFVVAMGLAAAHHMMIALAVPTLLLLTASPIVTYYGARWHRVLLLVLLLVLPALLVYALVPFAAARDPAISWGDVHDLKSWAWLVTRRDYGGVTSAVHAAGNGTPGERMAILWRVLESSFGVVGLLAAALGAAWLLRRETTIGVALLLAVLVTGPMFGILNTVETGSEEADAFFARFTTMSHVPVALLLGAGVAAAASRWPLARAAKGAGAALLSAWLAFAVWHARDVDLRDDMRGLAFAHDLVLGPPDGSLLLLSGDAPLNAAAYVCAVERLCGSRVVIAPGGLFMPWSMAQVRRRHPEITIPWKSGPGLQKTHELAAAEVTKRPVFAYPDLFAKDHALEGAFEAAPDHLLVRLWPRGTDPALIQTTFLASARAMVTGVGCEGCLLPPDAQPHPTQEMQIIHAYQAAETNHARMAERIPEAADLIAPLRARGVPGSL